MYFVTQFLRFVSTFCFESRKTLVLTQDPTETVSVSAEPPGSVSESGTGAESSESKAETKPENTQGQGQGDMVIRGLTLPSSVV